MKDTDRNNRKMSKIIQSAAALLLATSVFATSTETNASSAHQQKKKKTEHIEPTTSVIPSQTGIWINASSRFAYIYPSTVLMPGVLLGPSIRYQKNSFICSCKIELGWQPKLGAAAVGALLYQCTAGYQHKRHGIAVYGQYQPACLANDEYITAIGAEYSYLFGRSILFQARAGFTMMPEHLAYYYCGPDVGINVAYKVC